ncbi:MAG: phosphopentomutase, partial [Clostridia bacterium]
IFCGRGITKSIHTNGNDEGINCIKEMLDTPFNGLCFTNLVDFDMIFGHRNDINGYAQAMTKFDKFLGYMIENQKENDLYIITADHGCDPSTPSTDHSREYIPILVFGKAVAKNNYFGIRSSFSDIAATICDFLHVSSPNNGKKIEVF